MRAFTVIAVVLLAACKSPPPPPPAPPPINEAAVKSALVAFWDRFATAQIAGKVDDYLGMFLPDVTLDVQGASPIAGRVALDSVVRPAFASGKVMAFSITPMKTTVVSNDLVLQGGSYVEAVVVQGRKSIEYARYATSVVRGSDGQWRIAYWMSVHDSVVRAK